MKIGAETVAEILNKLIEPLSYKTMIFGILMCMLTMFWISASAAFLRGRSTSANYSRRSRQIHDDIPSAVYNYPVYNYSSSLKGIHSEPDDMRHRYLK